MKQSSMKNDYLLITFYKLSHTKKLALATPLNIVIWDTSQTTFFQTSFFQTLCQFFVSQNWKRLGLLLTPVVCMYSRFLP